MPTGCKTPTQTDEILFRIIICTYCDSCRRITVEQYEERIEKMQQQHKDILSQQVNAAETSLGETEPSSIENVYLDINRNVLSVVVLIRTDIPYTHPSLLFFS